MNTGTFLSNFLWATSCALESRSFKVSLSRVEEVQSRYLLNLVRHNTPTRFGADHGFGGITSVEQYQETVPITTYEDYTAYVNLIASGQDRVLTIDPVIVFQPTSGSISASKLVPYTRGLKKEFRRAISPWIYRLFMNRPELMRGKSYWSITPPAIKTQRAGAVRVGFQDDGEYLGSIGRRIQAGLSAVPQNVVDAPDVDSFFRQTLAHMLAASDLSLVSVWSPTFLLVLLDRLDKEKDDILRLLQQQRLVSVRRRQQIEGSLSGDSPLKGVWPHLRLVSCWTDGPSHTYAQEVQQCLPHIEIQGKGLIATEAFVSLPFAEGSDPVLAVESHFFEFRDVETGAIRLAHELNKGKIYSVIVSTGGGFYRYAIGDLVRVTGFVDSTPTLRFVCREDVSDYFGEKLSSGHVQASVLETFDRCHVTPTFFMVAPVRSDVGTISYCLFLDGPEIDQEFAGCVKSTLEELLRGNFHYGVCRDLGQLGPVHVFWVDRSKRMPEEAFSQEMHNRGIKLGDVKPTVFDKTTGWNGRFEGHFV